MSDVIAEAIAPADVPATLLEVFTPVVGEARLHFNEDGIYVRAVDAANVAMAHVTLDAAAFESYDAPGEATVGANLVAVLDRLGVGGGGDLAHLRVDMETRHLHVDVGNVSQQVSLIDTDAIREEPDRPDIDLPNTLVLTGAQIEQAVDAIDMVSDTLFVRSDPAGERAVLAGQGDTDETEVVFEGEDAGEGTTLTADGESVFSMEYAEKLAAPAPADAEVEIRFGDEMPMVWSWDALDGRLDVTQVCAPRIQSS